jgi:hypothetical protein
MVPSPPSATGILITSQLGSTLWMAISALCATSDEETEPLKESDAIIIFFIWNRFKNYDYSFNFLKFVLVWVIIPEFTPTVFKRNKKYSLPKFF